MKLRILTPTSAPTTLDLPTAPRRGDHILLAGDVLEVKRVVWPVTRYHKDDTCVVHEVEVHCDRAEDVEEPGSDLCVNCDHPIYLGTYGSDDPGIWVHVHTERHLCYRGPDRTETATPTTTLERI